MNTTINNFSAQQCKLAVQRLTALWAFAESGLGGMLHALQVPFTGLVVGGMAVLLITLIAFFSQQHYKTILHSLLIVLIVKATVSPHTPFPAYIAVSFQALAGFVLFSVLQINLLSILLLSVLAMMESAIQKLLILTLFFGQSFWKAADGLTDFVAKQFGMATTNGSNWIIGIYLLIYFIGGICIAWMAYKTIKEIFVEKDLPALDAAFFNEGIVAINKKRNRKRWAIVIILVIVAALLFLFAPDAKQGWIAVLKTLSWTSAVILLWYLLISPFITNFIKTMLKKKQSRYGEEVANALSFLPLLKQLSAAAWRSSNQYRGWRRLRCFSSIMVNWSLTSPAYNSPS